MIISISFKSKAGLSLSFLYVDQMGEMKIHGEK